MNEIKDVGRRLKEACLSGSVATLDALIEDDELILDRVSSLSGFYSDSPLHVAALRSHLDFTKALLRRKPKLATELDLQRRSPLHLASAEGHVEIVRELIIEYLLGIKSVKDRANVKNQNDFTALDIVEHCPIRDLRTMEIKELLLQAGVHKSFYMRPDSNAGSPPDNPPAPPQRCIVYHYYAGLDWIPNPQQVSDMGVENDFKLSLKISVGLELCWIAICGFVAALHAFHFLAWLGNKFRNLVTSYRSHKCGMGNFC
ncbi:hypothetical protein C3L33_14520, partial [Rhododendron williamsianum]